RGSFRVSCRVFSPPVRRPPCCRISRRASMSHLLPPREVRLAELLVPLEPGKRLGLCAQVGLLGGCHHRCEHVAGPRVDSPVRSAEPPVQILKEQEVRLLLRSPVTLAAARSGRGQLRSERLAQAVHHDRGGKPLYVRAV